MAINTYTYLPSYICACVCVYACTRTHVYVEGNAVKQNFIGMKEAFSRTANFESLLHH